MTQLFEVELQDAPEPYEVPTPETEASMTARLHHRYRFEAAGARRYAVAAAVGDFPVGATRRCDYMALDCWRSGGYALHGHEIKVSRSDWRKELADPDKAETFKAHCHYWWLVIPDLSIIRGGIPEGWGVLVAYKDGLRVAAPAPVLTPNPMPLPMQVAFTRAVASTAWWIGRKAGWQACETEQRRGES